MDEGSSPRDLINSHGSSFTEELPELNALLKTLSNEDRVAYRDRNAATVAQHDAPRLLVVAGPGSGKSYLFLHRIRHWLDTQDDPQIYVSSFVRKLVNDLENEIEVDIPEARKQVEATTLHTLARSIIEQNRGMEDLPLRPNVKVIADPWPGVVWRDVLAFHPEWSDGHPRRDLEAQYHDDALSEADDWVGLVATYDILRRFYNAVGFADMIVTARQAVEENPDLIQQSFWIIDEFQDFNTAEDHLIRAVTRDASQVLIAGDDEQALYQQLKASHPEIIVGYYESIDFANAMLPYCSRCSYYVCLAASAFIERHRDGDSIAKVFLPLEEDTGAEKVQIVAAATPGSAVDHVREFLENHHKQLEEHAEQLRTGEETDPFLLILTPERKVRFYRMRDADEELFDLVDEWADLRFEHSDDYWKVANYCATARNTDDNFALRKVFQHEGASIAEVHEVLVEALERDVSLAGVERDGVANAVKRCEAVLAVIESEKFGPDEKADRCAELISISDPERLASELEADAISGTTDEGEDAIEWGGGSSTVELLSIVGAKGLSAKHVMVLGCDDVNLDRTTQLAFYVALTRARESLHLIVAAKAGGSRVPHQFVLDLPEECCEITVHKKSGADELLGSMDALEGRLEQWASFG